MATEVSFVTVRTKRPAHVSNATVTATWAITRTRPHLFSPQDEPPEVQELGLSSGVTSMDVPRKAGNRPTITPLKSVLSASLHEFS